MTGRKCSPNIIRISTHFTSGYWKRTHKEGNVPNDRPEMFAQYHQDIDAFYQRVLEKNA